MIMKHNRHQYPVRRIVLLRKTTGRYFGHQTHLLTQDQLNLQSKKLL